MTKIEKKFAPRVILTMLSIMFAAGWCAHLGATATAAAWAAIGCIWSWRDCEDLQSTKRIEDAIRRERESK